jgi:hypothetical protein
MAPFYSMSSSVEAMVMSCLHHREAVQGCVTFEYKLWIDLPLGRALMVAVAGWLAECLSVVLT